MASTSTAMSVNSDYFFGWDLLYRTIENSINRKADVLIALTHFMLVKHSKFRCIGIGEDKSVLPDDVGSELIPNGWNDDERKYSLRYIDSERKLYLLLGFMTEDCVLINFLDPQTKVSTNLALEPELFVQNTKGSITQMIPSATTLVGRLRKEVIEPVFLGNSREVTTQTQATSSTDRRSDTERPDPLRISEPRRPRGEFVPIGSMPQFPFPDVGRGDLDPLGRLGPGNLLAFPPRPNFGDLRPRFDPFAPPDPNLGREPNPDHLQPPNFGGHNYYM